MMYNTSFTCLRPICLKGLKSANLGTSFSILTSDAWFTHFPLKKENKSDGKKTKQNKRKENKESHKQLKNNNILTGLSLVFEFPGTSTLCNCKEGYITVRDFSFTVVTPSFTPWHKWSVWCMTICLYKMHVIFSSSIVAITWSGKMPVLESAYHGLRKSKNADKKLLWVHRIGSSYSF